MHTVLQIPELIDLVFSKDLSRSELFRTALTCALWSNLALDYLWRNLTSLHPLFSLLAPLSMSQGTDGFMAWNFDPPAPFLYDWSRFNFYAIRVRSLGLRVASDGIGLSVYTTVAQFRPTFNLLPHLRDVKLLEYSTEATASIALFTLGPSIRSFYYYSACTEPEERSVAMEILHRRATQLQTLKLGPGVDSELLTRCVRSFPKLEMLETNHQNIDPPLWSALSEGPALKRLDFGACAHMDGATFTSTGFRSLQSLVLEAPMGDLMKLLETGNSPPQLREVEMTATDAQHASPTGQPLFRRIATSFPDIVKIAVLFKCRGDPITFDSFKSLLSSRSLKSLRMSHPQGVDITKDELAQVLKALPGLRAVTINKTDRFPISQIPLVGTHVGRSPLDILDVFAEHCPHIQEIGLSLDATNPTMTAPDGLCRLHNLKRLHVGLSDVGDEEAVAMYLAHRASRLMTLYWYPNGTGGTDIQGQRWKRVNELIKVLFAQRDFLERQHSTTRNNVGDRM